MMSLRYMLPASLLVLFVFGLRKNLVDADPLSNLFVLQADAFLHGRLDLEAYAFDCAEFGGRVYVPFPPVPAVVLLPFVALFGAATVNPTVVALGLSVLNATLLWRVLREAQVERSAALWSSAAFFLGTGYWSAAISSQGVWFFAHVCATTFCLFALLEAFGKARGWLVGLALGGAILCRQFTVLLAVFFLVFLWERELVQGRRRLLRVGGFALVVVAALGIYCAYDYARFGSPFDTGYAYLRRDGFALARFKKYGTFSPAYLPFNLWNLLLQGFHVDFTSRAQLGKMVANPFGTGLLQASPFVVLAFFSPKRRQLALAATASIGAMLLGHACYYLNGFVQINNQRFTLDFMPVLCVFIAWGLQHEMQRGRDALWKGCVVYAIVLNVVSLVAFDGINALLAPLG